MDLLAEQAEDIKGRVRILGKRITLPGALIDQIGTAAKDEGDISAPGMVLRLEGGNLPVAGDNYFPEPKRYLEPKKEIKPLGLESFKNPYGYRVTSEGLPRIALKTLPKAITSGKATITWKMKPLPGFQKRNGFLVLSHDPKGNAAVVVGSWMDSNHLSIFENRSTYWPTDREQYIHAEGELDCKAVLDMDARTVTLTVNGTIYEERFSETVPNVNYIGFATQNTDTLFTEPEITLEK